MGQGAEDAGGYEIYYDEHDSFNSDGYSIWHGKGQSYKVRKMSDRHIKNCIRMCRDLSKSANFTCDSEKWDDWVEVFQEELSASYRPILDKTSITSRGNNGNGKKLTKVIKEAFKDGAISTGSVMMKCHCGVEYRAKCGDLKRGWALSCSKRCAAIRRDFGRQAAEIVCN